MDAIPHHIFWSAFSRFWSNELAGLQWKRGSRWKVDQLIQKNIQDPEKQMENLVVFVCHKYLGAGLRVVSKYAGGKRDRGWKQESRASGGELNHLTEVLISGAMGGKVPAGQREESVYLLEAGQRLESWKRGKEMHFRTAIFDENKPKECPQQPETSETETVAKHAMCESYCLALLTLEVGRARRNHSTNTLWKTAFPKRAQYCGQYSRSSCEGFCPKNGCPPHFSLHLPSIYHLHLLCPLTLNHLHLLYHLLHHLL